ncbi:MAG: hypothetical protein ACOY0T_19840 [Myxococcota bacterium]
MVPSRSTLGDSHNFGRRVSVRGKRVAKPRALLWEWALLGNDSPIRKLLDEISEREGVAGLFSFLPTLRFFAGRERSAVGGEVERIVLEPWRSRSPARRLELAAIVGRSLALWSWLGVSDLHWENLILGVDRQNRTVFGPLDIEMIFAVLSLPTETKLLPDPDPEYAEICRHASGVRRVLPYLGKPVRAEHLLAMASAYCRVLALLDRHASSIAKEFSKLPGVNETPIRVCLRGTDEYVRARSEPVWPPLLPAEIEQLARGDIPYFFRLYDRDGIRYYADETLQRVEQLPGRGDVPKLDPILQLSRGLRSPARQKLRVEGLFTVLGAFDADSLTGTHEHGGLQVAFEPRSIIVRLEDGHEMEVRRKALRSIVGSVYLPCRCGEVRSVFVPAVTRCATP